MARVGPNQDINDPASIVNLCYLYQRDSNEKGDHIAQQQAQDPNATGPPIVDVSIPLAILDGSRELLEGSDITQTQPNRYPPLDYPYYDYDKDLVSDATLVTYIGLAERFREYWALLNAAIQSLDPLLYYTVTTFLTPYELIDGPLTRGLLSGSTSNIRYVRTYSLFHQSEPPSWFGSGPTDYNEKTYAELLSRLTLIEVQTTDFSLFGWSTNYYYQKYVDSIGGSRGSSTGFGLRDAFAGSVESVQFYNDSNANITISLSASIVATFLTFVDDEEFTTSYASWAEIDNVNQYPPQGDKSSLSSYESQNITKSAPGGTTTISISRDIIIPPGKSAFIGCVMGASTSDAPVDVMQVDVSMTLNGKTISSSDSLV